MLFGGWTNGSVPLYDTWVWDGAVWTELHPAKSPHAVLILGYDAKRQQVVGFGAPPVLGRFPVGTLGETWTWNGLAWSQVHPATNPTARAGATLTWDSKRERLIMVGGQVRANEFDQDVWAWDGNDWRRLAADQYAETNGVAYLPTDDTVVAYHWDSPQSRMSIFDGNIWKERPTGLNDLPELGVVIYDEQLGKLVIFGEHPNPPDGYTGSTPATWTWDGTTWSRINTESGPRCVSQSSIVYDSARQRLVLFGGFREVVFHSSEVLTNDLWEFDGRRWTQIQ
jgi:hypothetical protein